MKKRVWELDALRGLWILIMIGIHLSYDLVDLFAVVRLKDYTLYNWSQEWGGMLFLPISGISATLGSRPGRRGLQVFACGLLVSGVTVGMYLLGFADRGIIIYFGVLQCLAVCMFLWQLFRKCPTWLIAVFGAVFSAAGLYLTRNVRLSFSWLAPFGLIGHSFASSDYYPLLPNFGYFLLGAALGRILYPKKESLLPNVNTANPVIRFLTFCGRHSLIIYLVHQPILAAVIAAFLYL